MKQWWNSARGLCPNCAPSPPEEPQIQMIMPGKGSPLKKFVPHVEAKCFLCTQEGHTPGYSDLVGLDIGAHRIVICNSHAYALVSLLLGRFYPAWGDGPLFDKVRQEQSERTQRAVDLGHFAGVYD
jgi:hypothetical protein